MVEVGRLDLESPALTALRAAGVRVIVPLVTRGELIGALYLGPRLSDQGYGADDRALLATLAAQAAPAIRVAQLVREQAVGIQARERLDEEMRVAALIQQQFLPRDLPALPGWGIAAQYSPARAVGGDFYDFIALPDGRLGIVVGDVTDKGVPAALIMARTQSILRGEAPRWMSPSKVLERVNEILLPEMPARMFATCLYLVLDPATGAVVFANAGHNLPFVRTDTGVHELRATGMPLGLMGGTDYQEHSAVLAPGDTLLLYSDGIVEAHNPSGEMFGFPRLGGLMAGDQTGDPLLSHLLGELHQFTGAAWEQEDDITLVTVARRGGVVQRRELLRLEIAGAPGNERTAMDAVSKAVVPLGMPPDQVDRLKTAVSEAAMNAIEYGSRGDPAVPFVVVAVITGGDLLVSVTDRGSGGHIGKPEEPDLDAKLDGRQKPRGWGQFLIQNMVDAMEVVIGETGRTVVLTIHLGPAGTTTGDER